MGPGMMGYGGFSTVGGGILIHVFMLLFWILFIAGIVLLVRWVWDSVGERKNGTAGGERQQDAREILKQRYAKGEISREEFQTMKQDLE